jgi:predicted NBD/HSP70 family sugar kinase
MIARAQQKDGGGPRHNERLVLTCLRRVGAASKPDLARQVALTPQAVHTIVDGLVAAGLVEAGGRREGLIGHPSTLYAISPGGAFAIGVEIGPRRLETALINFTGQMIYRGQVTYPKLDATNLVDATLSSVEAALAHARSTGIDPSRIAGTGIVATTDIDASLTIEGTLISALQRRAGIQMPVYVERRVVAEALLFSIFSPVPMPSTSLFITMGHTVDGCLMLDGVVRNAGSPDRNRFRLLPISATETLGDVAGFASLASRVGVEQNLDLSTEVFFRATQADPPAFDAWLDDSATALATAIAAVHSIHVLERVFIDVAPPVSVGDMLVERIGMKLRDRGRMGIEYPAVHRVVPPASPALPAGAIALHELYAPGGRARQRTPLVH